MSTAIVKEQASTHCRFSKEESDILAIIDAVSKAHHDKDANALVAPYAADAAVFNLAPTLWRQGLKLEEMKAWLETWEGPIERESRDFSVTVTGDHAFCHGFYRLSGTPKSAGRVISFWMRVTLVLSKQGSSWQIVHEHTSVPFYMDGSLRPAFDLEP
jgi:ketosteroid isomerase-like protein